MHVKEGYFICHSCKACFFLVTQHGCAILSFFKAGFTLICVITNFQISLHSIFTTLSAAVKQLNYYHNLLSV